MSAILDPGEYAWSPGAAGCRLRRAPVAGVIWHWTAGGGSPEAVVRVLRQRGLSVHRIIGKDGRVLRCADPKTTVCYHAGSRANERFVGVEICSPGIGSPEKHGRKPVAASAHGRKFAALDFTPEQYAAIITLADELSEEYGIPRVTAQGDGVIDIRAFSGHAEHIHVSKRKIDCGTLVTSALRAVGYG